MKTVRFATRLLIGGLFVGHGTQKLIGAFDGPGIDGTETMMEKIGMHPAKANAYAAGVTETAGGAMFALGRVTPLSGAALIGTMITAIRKVHGPNGPWISKRGWEYNAVLIAAIAAIIEDEHNVAAALAAIGLGAAASAAVIQLAEQAKASQPYPTAAPAVDEPVGSAGQGDTGTVTPEGVRAGLRRSA